LLGVHPQGNQHIGSASDYDAKNFANSKQHLNRNRKFNNFGFTQILNFAHLSGSVMGSRHNRTISQKQA